MANILAAASGNWSATATWVGGVVPTAGDTVMSNGFTVAVNVDISATQLRADAFGGATAGGGFTVAAASGATRTINASLYGANLGITFASSTATVSVVGDVTNTSTQALSTSGSGTVNITGTLSSVGNVNWFVTGSPTINITGNIVYSGTAFFGTITMQGGGVTVNVTGNLINNQSNYSCINSQGANTINVIGAVNGGPGTGVGITASSGTVSVSGTATGGTGGAAISISAGTLTLTRAVGGVGAVGVAQSSSAVCYIEEIEYGITGQSPTSGFIRLTDTTANKCLFYRVGLSKKTVADVAGLGILPAVADVRKDVTFNAGQLTGLCAVPAAGAVALGVAVGATVGTAILTSGSIQTACDAALTAFASGRLANVATTATTGQQIADATF